MANDPDRFAAKYPIGISSNGGPRHWLDIECGVNHNFTPRVMLVSTDADGTERRVPLPNVASVQFETTNGIAGASRAVVTFSHVSAKLRIPASADDAEAVSVAITAGKLANDGGTK